MERSLYYRGVRKERLDCIWNNGVKIHTQFLYKWVNKIKFPETLDTQHHFGLK